MSSNKPLRSGVWPVMITPFTEDKQIDWLGIDRLTNWYIESGVAGIFTVCQSSEMYKLSNEERLDLARRVVKSSAGRVAVVAAGTFFDTTDKNADFIKQMADTGVAAVVWLVNNLAKQDQSDEIWKKNAEKLLEKTGNINLGLYECPTPYHRLLPSEIVGWLASTNRFIFMKQTCPFLDIIKKKIELVKNTPLLVFNADAASLLESLRIGAAGYGSIAANFYPALWVWLCKNYKDQPETAEKLQRFLSIAEGLIRFKYPMSAKYFLASSGMKINTVCRMCDYKFLNDEPPLYEALKQEVLTWYRQLSLPEKIC